MQITPTEQRLCRIWHLAETTGDWWEANAKCHEIAVVLSFNGCAEVAQLFADAAALAISRIVMNVKEKETA